MDSPDSIDAYRAAVIRWTRAAVIVGPNSDAARRARDEARELEAAIRERLELAQETDPPIPSIEDDVARAVDSIRAVAAGQIEAGL